MKLSLKQRIIIASAVSLAVMLVLLAGNFGGNITGFFRIGDVLPLSPHLDPGKVHIVEGEVGYDGQLFLTIALDPLLRQEGTLHALDNSKYRYRRIGFPLVGFLLGLGSSVLIPYAMVLVNVLSITAIAAFAYLLARGDEADWTGELLTLLVIAVPGLWISLCLTTSDLLGTALMLASLYLLSKEKAAWAGTAMALACLTRETYLAVAGVLMLFMFARFKKKEAAAMALSAVPMICWYFYAGSATSQGTSGTAEILGVPLTGILGVPLTGILGKFRAIEANGISAKALFEAGCFAALLGAACLMLVSLVRNRKNLTAMHIAAIPGLVLVGISMMQILEYHANYLRVFGNLFILLTVVRDTRRVQYAKLALFAFCAALSLAYVGNFIASK
jgi:hypothetical protein